MKNNNHGRAAGLALIGILIAALLVAWLTLNNFTSLGGGGSQQDELQETTDLVQQVEDTVNEYNENIQQEIPDEEE